MARSLYIRADGNPEIGMGHISRCIALANMLKGEFVPLFYMKESVAVKLVQSSGFNVVLLETEVEFIATLKGREVVVLDGYHFHSSYQVEIRNRGSLLICIDDLHNGKFEADIIINHSPGASVRDYETASHSKLLLGLDFALLRPAFLENAISKRPVVPVDCILICFGGSDQMNLTTSIVKVVLKYASMLKKILIVTGAAFAHTASLESEIGKVETVKHFHNVSEQTMIEIMQEAQAAIVQSSGILIESIAMKLINIAGYYVNNQIETYNGFVKLNSIIGVDNFDLLKVDKALSDVLIEQKWSVKFDLIDGQSGRRTCGAILSSYISRYMEIRRATLDDSSQYFEWANDPDVRKNSIGTEKIEWLTHTGWFETRVQSEKSQLFVSSCDHEMIGQVRFEREDEKWIIGFSIDKKFRGLKLGTQLVKKAITMLRKYSSLPICATIRDANISSLRIFEILRFSKSHSEQGYTYYILN
ncbi:MAG: UDP-2,4-diacetamido-2,4,6-trideoxy-beta-L-altropyranose hydrolase [Chryseolinea sp.]